MFVAILSTGRFPEERRATMDIGCKITGILKVVMLRETSSIENRDVCGFSGNCSPECGIENLNIVSIFQCFSEWASKVVM